MKKVDINFAPRNSHSFLPPLYFVKDHLKIKEPSQIPRNSSIFKSSTKSTSKFDSKDDNSLAFQTKLLNEKNIGYKNYSSAKDLTDYKSFLTSCNTELIDKMIDRSNNKKEKKMEPKYINNKKSEIDSLPSSNEIQNANTSFFKSFEEKHHTKVFLSSFLEIKTSEKEKNEFFKGKSHFRIKQRAIDKGDEAYFKHLNKQEKASNMKKNQKSFLSELEKVFKNFTIKNESITKRKNEKKIQFLKKISERINDVSTEQNKLMKGLMETFEKNLY